MAKKKKAAKKEKASFYLSPGIKSKLKRHCLKPSVGMSMSDFVDGVLSKVLGTN